MKRKIKLIIPFAIIMAVFTMLAVACGGNPYKFPPYSYENPDRNEEPLVTDAEITLDGILDETIWQDADRRWFDAAKATDPTVNVRATSYIGEKGVYMAFDVDDTAVTCLNPKYTALNSAIELYISAYADARNNAYEIDFTADGRCGVKVYNVRGELVEWQARVASGVKTKGGAVNTTECKGYVIEAFLPNHLFGGSAPESVYADVAVITTTDAEADGSREWYPFAWKEYGGVWMEPVTWFVFDGNGFASGFQVKVTGDHAVLESKPMGIKNSNYTALIAAEEGYAITAVSCNGQNIDNRVKDTENGVRLDLSAVSEDLNFTVTTESISEGNKTLSGTVYLHKDAKKTPASSVTLTLTQSDETIQKVTTDGQGKFSIENLPQGFYVLSGSLEGCGELSETVLVNRDRNKTLLFEAETFVGNADWDLTDVNEGFMIASGETPLQMKESQNNFILKTKVSISLEAEERLDRRNGDLRYELWAIYDAESGSLAGKYFGFDLYRTHSGNDVVWKVQIPNRNDNCVAGNWIDVYTLNESQINSVRSEEGIEIAIARDGKKFTMFLNGIPVADYTVSIDGADTAKVFPAFVFVDDSKQSARFFDWSFTTVLNKDEWNTGYVKLDKDLEHGMISVDQDSYQLDDSVVITANPDSGYVCIDIIINGVSYGSEIVNDRLTVNFDRKVLNITAVFIDENSKTEDKTVNFPDADGLEVRLVKGGTVVENSTKTVADGKVVFQNLNLGWYRIQMKAFGVWADTDSIFAVDGNGAEVTCTIENADVFVSGVWNVPATSGMQSVACNVNISDGWFAVKLSGVSGWDKNLDDSARFGFYFEYEGIAGNRAVAIDWKKDSGWILQEVGGSWDQGSLPIAKDWNDVYFALHRSVDGTITVYLGTTPENLMQVAKFTSKKQYGGETNTQSICKFGVYKEGEGNTAYSVNFSDIRYGTTLAEAFGLSDGAITITNNATANDVDKVHGTVTVKGENIGDEITITVTLDNSNPNKHYNLTSLLINGIERKDDLSGGSLKLADKYMSETLMIAATFEEAKKYGYSASVNLLKHGQESANGTLVFTDATGTCYEIDFKDSQLKGELYTGVYTVTVKGEERYVFENATVTVGTEPIEDAALNAAWSAYPGDSYADAVAANTVVEKTINGQEITFDGTLNLGQGATKAYYKGLSGNFDFGAFYQLPKDINLDDNSSHLTAFTMTLTMADGKYLSLRIHREQDKGWRLDTPHWDLNNLLKGSGFEKYIYMSGNGGKQGLNVSYSPDLKNGVYLQIVRVGSQVRLILDGVLINTFENITGDFTSCTFNNTVDGATVCPKIDENITEFSKVALAGWTDVSIAEGVAGDFTAEFSVKVSNINDFRGGVRLVYKGGCIEFNLTNVDDNNDGAFRLDIKGNAPNSLITDWPTLYTVPTNDSLGSAIAETGVTFKVVRTGGVLKLYIGDGATEVYSTANKDLFKDLTLSGPVNVLANHDSGGVTLYAVSLTQTEATA